MTIVILVLFYLDSFSVQSFEVQNDQAAKTLRDNLLSEMSGFAPQVFIIDKNTGDVKKYYAIEAIQPIPSITEIPL